ncbi:MAG: asparagine synthase (glutamine-hydrolyzing), partial [Burkholderiales bacterium]|nr:asparagine synthase (glutamine-hydrolyzing) [Burkholderiales bacterium]
LMHSRLAVLDLSPAGCQPMLSSDGRYVIVFNGEIYNFEQICKDIEIKFGSVDWRGHSDTEIILMAIIVYGVEGTLSLLEGMFAIALWDRKYQTLYLFRDRMGEKPLYFGYFQGVFGFSSELKALHQHPKFQYKLNRDALGQLLLHNCIPAPLSIFDGIYKLLPGHYLKLNYSNYTSLELPPLKAYWKLADHLAPTYTKTIEEATSELEGLLKQVVALQMIADVPVGCFLSGGIDSSMISALMQSISTKPIKTFSIGFNNSEYNEAPFAKAIANYLGTEHTELYVSQEDALKVIPQLPLIYDEPFADVSQIPTYLLAKLARQQVTVALSGDGGDELFAGYTRYNMAPYIYNKLKSLPLWSRSLLGKILAVCSINFLTQLGKLCNLPIHKLQDKIAKLDDMLRVGDFSGMYLCLTGHWLNYQEAVIGIFGSESIWLQHNLNLADPVLNMQYLDAMGYLTDDILVKVDRSGMANSLETRIPLLNHKLVEFAFSLPTKYRMNKHQSKIILRNVLYKYVPKELLERPKAGFSVPIQEWLRGELKEWMLDMLSSAKLKQQGYFNPQFIEGKLTAHLSGGANNGYYLWSVLMFQQWLEYWKQSDTSSLISSF